MNVRIILKNSSTTKASKHMPSGFPMSTISKLKSIENKHDVNRGKDCMKKFCEYLEERTLKIIIPEKKKMKLSTKEKQESYENAKIHYICEENLKIDM